MKILVCIKLVPDTETKIKISGDGSQIDPAGIKWVVNPYDEFAIEEAIKTKEANSGASVSVMTIGPKKRSVDGLRTALAMGADDGVVVECEDMVDSLTTAKILAAAIRKQGPYDIVFTGKLAIDDNQSCVSQMVAELLELPHTSVVGKFELGDQKAKVERETEGGTKEVVEMKLPALIAANKGLNMPRYASLPGIMKAKKKPMVELSLSDLEISSTDNKVTFKGYRLPPEKPPVKMLDGEIDAQVSQLATLLREEAKVL